MRQLTTFTAVIAAVGLVFAAESSARKGMDWKGSGGWGVGSQYNQMYDLKTIETHSGEVVSMDNVTPIRGMSYGIHLTLKTEKETVSVHLGPGWYIENQDIKIEPKDKVDVTGSRITYEGKPAILAAEIKKGEETLNLRDEGGVPVWSGTGKR